MHGSHGGPICKRLERAKHVGRLMVYTLNIHRSFYPQIAPLYIVVKSPWHMRLTSLKLSVATLMWDQWKYLSKWIFSNIPLDVFEMFSFSYKMVGWSFLTPHLTIFLFGVVTMLWYTYIYLVFLNIVSYRCHEIINSFIGCNGTPIL